MKMYRFLAAGVLVSARCLTISNLHLAFQQSSRGEFWDKQLKKALVRSRIVNILNKREKEKFFVSGDVETRSYHVSRSQVRGFPSKASGLCVSPSIVFSGSYRE
jgi:hypothetical protein